MAKKYEVLSVRIEDKLKAELEQTCKEYEITKTELFEALIRAFIDTVRGI